MCFSTFSAGLFQRFIPPLLPCRGCCAQPSPGGVGGTQPCPWSSHCAARAFLLQNILELDMSAVPHSLLSWTLWGWPGSVRRECSPGSWCAHRSWQRAGGGKVGASQHLRLYTGNLENINCRQHWVALTGFQFLSGCRYFVSLKVLLNYHLGSPAMALLGLLWAKTHIYSFFTYPEIQGMCSPKWNTFGSKQLLSR